MSDQIDQEQIQRSFPSTSIPEFSHNRKEETITNLPSFIDSLPNNNNNNNNNSSSLMSSTIDTIMSTNDEPNSSTPKTKKAKSRSRKTNSSSGHPIRNKISKDSSTKNEPYTIPYSTRSQTQQLRQQDSSSLAESQSSPSTIVDSNATESTGVNVMNVSQSQSQVSTTGRKKYCAKCKESSNITKIINSKISRIEELVKDLKKVTDGFSHGVGTNVSQSSKSFTSFGGIDFSKMSIGDLQNFVMIITNAIMTTASTNTSTNNSSLSNVKLEFEESRSGPQLKIEKSQ